MRVRCDTCNRSLPTQRFAEDKRTSSGYNPTCYQCRSIAQDGDTDKACLMCGDYEPLKAFPYNLKAADLHHKACRTCASRTAKQWQRLNPQLLEANRRVWTAANRAIRAERARQQHLTKTYNLSVEDYWKLFDKQGGVCAICGTPPRTRNLHVDHDHACCKGRISCGACVRGLLCSRCNTKLLPIVEHHPQIAAQAAAYLAETRINK